MQSTTPPAAPFASCYSGQPVAPGDITVQGQTPDSYNRVYLMLPLGTTMNPTAQVPWGNTTYGASADLVVNLDSLTVVSNALYFDGTNWCALKTATNNWVYVQASLNTGDPTAGNQIQWTGGESVPGNPFQRRVTTTKCDTTTVQATLGATTLKLKVWVYPGTLHSLTVVSNATPIDGTNWARS